MQEFEAWMRAVEAEGAGFSGDLPAVSDGRVVLLPTSLPSAGNAISATPSGRSAWITHTSIVLQPLVEAGNRIPDSVPRRVLAGSFTRSASDAPLVRAYFRWAKLVDGPTPNVRVAPAVDATWSDMVRFVQAARESGYTVSFVVAAKGALQPPAETSPAVAAIATRAVERDRPVPIDPSKRAKVAPTDEERTPLSAWCPAGRDVYRSSTPSDKPMEPAEAYAARRSLLVAAVRACGCDFDLNIPKAYFWAESGRYSGPPVKSLELRAPTSASKDVAVLAYTADTLWKDAGPAAVAAAEAQTPVTLLVK